MGRKRSFILIIQTDFEGVNFRLELFEEGFKSLVLDIEESLLTLDNLVDFELLFEQLRVDIKLTLEKFAKLTLFKNLQLRIFKLLLEKRKDLDILFVIVKTVESCLNGGEVFKEEAREDLRALYKPQDLLSLALSETNFLSTLLYVFFEFQEQPLQLRLNHSLASFCKVEGLLRCFH